MGDSKRMGVPWGQKQGIVVVARTNVAVPQRETGDGHSETSTKETVRIPDYHGKTGGSKRGPVPRCIGVPFEI